MRHKPFIIICILLISHIFVYGEERGIVLLAQQLDQNIQVGKQYVLLVGIDKYEYWMPLKNPVNDAQEIRDILTSRYYIDEVIELYDSEATRANIIRTFINLQKKLEIHDSLLIFYAGHGDFNKETNTSAWIPVNAGTDPIDKTNWIGNSELIGLISNIEATHICLVSDSCFSGDIITSIRGSSPHPGNIPYFRETYKLTSRQVLTSGSSETVPDESEFSFQLKMALKKNSDPFLDPLMLYNQIRLGVRDTIPLLGSLKGTGHQDGASFLLFLKDTPVKEPGYITITTKTSGKLYINDEYRDEIGAGGSINVRFNPGDYTVKILYSDGEIETDTVTVESGETTDVGFDRVEPIVEIVENAEKRDEVGLEDKISQTSKPKETYRRMERNYFSTRTGFGLNIPLGDASEIAGPGYKPLVHFSYNFVDDWGVIGLGLTTGTGIEPIKEGLHPVYTLYAIPLAVSITYTTNFDLPFYGFAGITGGVNINIYNYESESIDAIIFAVPFVEPVVGIGYNFVPGFGISLFGSFPVVMYRSTIHMWLSPGIMIEINF